MTANQSTQMWKRFQRGWPTGVMARSEGAVTIREVAERAGVAVSTVSRVLSGGYCSEATRDRVLQATRELNYRPNQVARSLVRKESRTIGLIIPDITNPFFPALTRGVEDRARAAGYAVLLANTDGDLALEETAIRALLGQQIDGLVVTAVGKDASKLIEEAQERLPVVVMDRTVASLQTHSVVVENVTGARRAVEHLLSLGHRRIAYIGGVPGVVTEVDRMTGYTTALESAGLPVVPELLRHGHFNYEGGYAAMRDLLSERFTAVFAANDLMALGAMKAIHEAGLRIPEEISVVGFDDIPFAQMAFPPLTTVRQPAYELGAMAAEMLVKIRQGQVPTCIQSMIFQPELVQRESTGPVKQS